MLAMENLPADCVRVINGRHSVPPRMYLGPLPLRRKYGSKPSGRALSPSCSHGWGSKEGCCGKGTRSNCSAAALSFGMRTSKGLRSSVSGNKGPEYGSPIKRKNSSHPPGTIRPRNSV